MSDQPINLIAGKKAAAALRKHVAKLNHRVTDDRKAMRAAAATIDRLTTDLARARRVNRIQRESIEALRRQVTRALADLRAERKLSARARTSP